LNRATNLKFTGDIVQRLGDDTVSYRASLMGKSSQSNNTA
jgi:hypothetical protein